MNMTPTQSINVTEKYAFDQGRRLLRSVVRTGPTAANDRRIRWFPLLARLATFGQYTSRAARVASALAAALAAVHANMRIAPTKAKRANTEWTVSEK